MPIVHRNLAIAWWHRHRDARWTRRSRTGTASRRHPNMRSISRSWTSYTKRRGCSGEAAGAAREEPGRVSQRDDSLAHEAGLLVSLQVRRSDQAADGARIRSLGRRQSERADDWTDAHMLRGQKLLEAKHARGTGGVSVALEIPTNLPSEGIDVSGREPEAITGWERVLGAGDAAQAKRYWQSRPM